MTNDREKDIRFYLRFIYVHSTFLANKRIFMDSKQKVVKSHWNNGGLNSLELAVSYKALKTLKLVRFLQPLPWNPYQLFS